MNNSQRYQLKWAKSKKRLDEYIEHYNADKPLRAQLRPHHKALAQYLLYIYSRSIIKAQAYGGGLSECSPLPLLRTNNVQLAKAMGCGERTIINLRERLKAAKVITKEVFRGSNASYEVGLSDAVIHIQRAGEPANIVHFFGASRKTLRHTVTGKTIQETKELIELSGLDFQQPSDFQANELVFAVENDVNTCGKPESVVENQHPSSSPETPDTPETLETRTGNENGSANQETPPELRRTPQRPVPQRQDSHQSEAELSEVPTHSVGTGKAKSVSRTRKTPSTMDHGPTTPKPTTPQLPNPTTPPKTLIEALKGIDPQITTSITRHVNIIWTCALLNLYDDKWIAEEEAERAKAVLAEYFIYTTPDRFQAGAAEIIERIVLVRRWIERGQAKGENRWVPLPAKYFDFRNQKGFTRTKPWFKAHMKAKAEIKAKELLTKAIKEYLRAQEPGAKIGPSETYRRIAQRLGKYDSDLLNRFHAQIANVHATATQKKTA